MNDEPDFLMCLEVEYFDGEEVELGIYYDYSPYESATSTYPGADAAIDVGEVVWMTLEPIPVMDRLTKDELESVTDACWGHVENKHCNREEMAEAAADAAYERQREERLEQLNRDKEYFSNIAREFQDEALADNARRRK